jgi:2-dehydro-3-deoxyphosphogalactonate aldolase
MQTELPPIIAILRGVKPAEVVDIAASLVEAGIRAIEVPLNSPEPFESLRRLSAAVGAKCVCGAGTVLEVSQVDRVRDAGGSLVVSPNVDVSVIERSIELGLIPMPGFATATEAFTAIKAGARHLKLFPAATYGVQHVTALRAVIPDSIAIFAVGGVGPAAIQQWRRAGVAGFGIGGELYRAGQDARTVAERAAAVVAAVGAAVNET